MVADFARLNQPLVDSWLGEAKKWLPNSILLSDFIKSPTRKADVYVVTVSTLQREHTAAMIRELDFQFIVVDECQVWVRGRPGDTSNQLLQFRHRLVPKARAVFFLSGTPFKGDMCWDLVETIKSLATDQRRQGWSTKIGPTETVSTQFPYCDEALSRLSKTWAKVPDRDKTQMLVPIMIRRTPKTILEGHSIIRDYMGMLKYLPVGEINIASLSTEMSARQQLMVEYSVPSKDRLSKMRSLAYTPKYLTRYWEGTGRTDLRWWDGFTVENACEFRRGRTLYQVLRDWRTQGFKPLVFAYGVFQQQFAARVPPQKWPSDNNSYSNWLASEKSV
jgi:hypothetical protein